MSNGKPGKGDEEHRSKPRDEPQPDKRSMPQDPERRGGDDTGPRKK